MCSQKFILSHIFNFSKSNLTDNIFWICVLLLMQKNWPFGHYQMFQPQCSLQKYSGYKANKKWTYLNVFSLQLNLSWKMEYE